MLYSARAWVDRDRKETDFARLHDGGAFSPGEREHMRSLELFADLDPSELSQLEGAAERLWIPAGTTVLEAGAESKGLLLLLSGICEVMQGRGAGRRTVATVRAGEVLGALSLLAAGPRSMDVVTRRDSVFAWLPLAWFDAHALGLPGLVLRLARVAASRALDPTRRGARLEPTARTFTLRALGQGVELARVCAALVAGLGRLGSVAVIDYPRYSAAREAQTPTTNALNALEAGHDYALYLDDGDGDAEWALRCSRHTDRTLFVGDGVGEAQTAPSASAPRARALVLVQPDHVFEASGTQAWIDRNPELEGPYHLRLGRPGDVERLARLITGQAIGVAISGASARGVAHYGLLGALERLSIPVDVVAGNSSGALVAACVSAGFDLREAAAIGGVCIDAGRPRLRELGPPLVSLASGRGMSSVLKAALGERRAEDQFIPVIMTAVDLARGTLVELRTGPLWLGVRSSSSLPAYWPPVVRGSEVLVDGGILANLPIEPLERHCAGGVIVASDLDTADEDFNAFPEPYPSGAVLSGWRVLATPWRKYPRLSEIVMHAMSLSSYAHHAAALQRAGEPNMLFVRLDMPFPGFFGVSPDQVDALVDLGHVQALPKLQASWPAHARRLGHPQRREQRPTPAPKLARRWSPSAGARAALCLLGLLSLLLLGRALAGSPPSAGAEGAERGREFLGAAEPHR